MGVVVSSNLIWVDLEMTGLDPEHNVIIEIATIVTDTELNVVAEGPNLAINQPESALSLMDDWNLSHHRFKGSNCINMCALFYMLMFKKRFSRWCSSTYNIR